MATTDTPEADPVPHGHRPEPWAFLRQRWYLIVLTAALAAATALVVSLLQTDQYVAEAELLINEPRVADTAFPRDAIPSPDAGAISATDLELVSLDRIAEEAALDVDPSLDMEEVEDVADRVSVIRKGGTSNLLVIGVSDDDPETASELANTFAEKYISFRREIDQEAVAVATRSAARQLGALDMRELKGVEGRTLRQQIARLKSLESLQTGDATVVDPADAPDSADSPSPLRNAAIGGILGLLVGAGLALVLDRTDRRQRRAPPG